MSNPEVLAKAEHLNRKVVAITNGSSPIGNAICDHVAKAGASVFSLDASATKLAQQSISFRQNNLRLRGVPCDLTSEDSVQEAVQEIVSHAPPIDFWIHAEILHPSEVSRLNLALFAFGQHFDMRGKGTLLLISTMAQSKVLEKAVLAELDVKKYAKKATLKIIESNTSEAAEIAKKVVTRLIKE